MKPGLKEQFVERWRKYFADAALPITFYYTDDPGDAQLVRASEGQHCFIGDLTAARQGKALCFDTKSIACFGGKRYLGFHRT